jgi:hypothetical protein
MKIIRLLRAVFSGDILDKELIIILKELITSPDPRIKLIMI